MPSIIRSNGGRPRRDSGLFSSAVALPLNRVILNLCGATILKLETSGGIVMTSKHHWSRGGEVSVQSVERNDSGGWIVSGVLAPKAGAPSFATMRSLAMRFNGILRSRVADPLPAWIDDAIETD